MFFPFDLSKLILITINFTHLKFHYHLICFIDTYTKKLNEEKKNIFCYEITNLGIQLEGYYIFPKK